MQKLSTGVLRFMTGVWTLSNDRSVLVQQKRECTLAPSLVLFTDDHLSCRW